MRNSLEILVTAALFAPMFSSCNPEASGPVLQTSCPAGAALIAVNDGYLETLCGCAEASPAYYSAGNRLLCTVTSGTTVMFEYLVTHTRHQVVPTGTPDFPPSPLSNPEDPNTKVRAHAVRLDASGTYSFEDSFDNSLVGDIVVL